MIAQINLLPESASPSVVVVPKPPVQEDVGGDPLEYLSPSRLKSFLTCRLRFYFEKVMGIRKPKSVALHFGASVHTALQKFNKERWRKVPISDMQVVSAFRDALNATDEPVSFENADEKSELLRCGENLLKAYLLSPHAECEARPRGVEVSLSAELPGVPIPLVGVADLITEGNVVVDYKTTAATPNAEHEAWLHETQLVAYSLLLEDATNEPCGGMDLVYLVKTKTPKVIVHRMPRPTPIQRDRFCSLARIYAAAVEREFYYPCPGQHCSWCQYREECGKWEGCATCN